VLVAAFGARVTSEGGCDELASRNTSLNGGKRFVN